MKKQLPRTKKGLILGVFALSLSLSAQTDATHLLTNPSFETGDLTGWTWSGTEGYGWLGPNTDGDATKDGEYICGIWNGSIGDAECTQTLTNVPNGYYKITAYATVSTGRTTNQRLFATSAIGTTSRLYGGASNPAYTETNLGILETTETSAFGGYTESSSERGPFKKLAVISQVTDGNLTLGFKVSGKASTLGYDFSHTEKGDAGFFKFDNFTLTEVSDVATLDAITLDKGSLNTPFDPAIETYQATLPVGTTTVTPSVIPTVDGVLIFGTEEVDVTSGTGSSTILVTSLNSSTTKEYVINYTVLSLSDDATLSDLTFTAGELTPAFSPSVTTYTLLVPVGTTSVTIGATQNDAKARVEGAGAVELTHGKATVTLTVTAENDTTKTYVIKVDQAYLTNPSFETGDLTGWTLTGAVDYVWMGVNNDGDDTKTGEFIAGLWNPQFGDVELSQTVTGLTNGAYLITADLMGSRNGTTSRLTTQRVFANNVSMLFGADTAYSAENLAILGATETYSFGGYPEIQQDNGPFRTLTVIAPVTDGTLTVGVRTNGKLSEVGFTFPNRTEGDGHGWFKVDNFTMTYYGESPSSLEKRSSNTVSFGVSNRQLTVSGTKAYVVYSIQGMKLAAVTNNQSGTTVTLEKGLYLVKTMEGQTVKIAVN